MRDSAGNAGWFHLSRFELTSSTPCFCLQALPRPGTTLRLHKSVLAAANHPSSPLPASPSPGPSSAKSAPPRSACPDPPESSPGSQHPLKPVAQAGVRPRRPPALAQRGRANLRPRFEDEVERRFRRPAESAEPGRRHHLPDSLLAGLCAQAQSHFLRS